MESFLGCGLILWVALIIIGIICGIIDNLRSARQYRLAALRPGGLPSQAESALAAKREADEAARQAERHAARRHLVDFYDAHADLLADVCTPALLKAFLKSEMHDGLEPVQLWDIAKQRIAQLEAAIKQVRKRRKTQDAEAAQHAKARRHVDSEIADLRERIDKLRTSTIDKDLTNNEILALEHKIKRLLEQKDNIGIPQP